MKLLLDRHALLWWLADLGRLGPHARDLIAEKASFLSDDRNASRYPVAVVACSSHVA